MLVSAGIAPSLNDLIQHITILISSSPQPMLLLAVEGLGEAIVKPRYEQPLKRDNDGLYVRWWRYTLHLIYVRAAWSFVKSRRT